VERTYKGLVLDAFQIEAIDAIDRGEDVIVAAPTGAGKTLIAQHAIESALRAGKRVIYTAPIKALSNQKFRDLTIAFPGQVGIATGDVSIDPGAAAVIMTTEIFRNTLFDDPRRVAEVAWVIFDEVHYIDDPERGTVWEESLIFAPPGVKILALSATVSNLQELAAWLTQVRGNPVKVVLETHRPVPLDFFVASTQGQVRPLDRIGELRPKRRPQDRRERRGDRPMSGRDRMRELERSWKRLVLTVSQKDELPLLFFLFSRDACQRLARSCMGERLVRSRQAREAAVNELNRLVDAFELDRSDPAVGELAQLIEHGIAYHHAGLLPALKEVVERLFDAGHIRLLCATETFALGVNMPARAVAFEGIRKFDGKQRLPLKTREFLQMAGRAGRRGIDDRGAVYITFDPNQDDPATVKHMALGKVEPVESQFNLSYGTLINLWGRLGEKLFEACEKSFASYRATHRNPGPPVVPVGRQAPEAEAPGGVARRGGERGQRSEKPKRRGEPEHPLHAKGAEPEQDPGQRGRGRHGDKDEPRAFGRRRRGRPGRSERMQARGGEGGPRDAVAPAAAPPVGKGGGFFRYRDVVTQVRRRLELLRRVGCIDASGQVTARGRFAQQVFGHELVMTELVHEGLLDGLSPSQVAVVVTAVVFEARKGVFYGGPDPAKLVSINVYRGASRRIGDLWQSEVDQDIRPPTKVLDWSLSGVVWAWTHGAEFAELRELTDASDGDIVRTLRQTIQILRLCQRPLTAAHRNPLAHTFREAMGLLKRGLVDAEWQIRKGRELEDGTLAPEDPLPKDAPQPASEDTLDSGEELDEGPLDDGEPHDEDDASDAFGAGLEDSAPEEEPEEAAPEPKAEEPSDEEVGFGEGILDE
jgi:superfamily II RNA helicase